MRFLAIAFLVIGFSGCTPSDDVVVQKAKTIIGGNLKDPASAIYKDLFVLQLQNTNHDTESKWIVCGEVNSKNSLGGYSGYQKFAVTSDSDKPLYEGQLNSTSDKGLFNLLYRNCKSSTLSRAWK